MSDKRDVPTRQKILVTDILLDQSNVRSGNQSNQAAAIGAMIEDQGFKLVALAKHIGEMGLSPMELISVVPAEAGKFVVVEGNRRITALKLLNAPELAQGTPIEKRIGTTASEAENIPFELECLVFSSRDSAKPWIDIRHNVGLGGVGIESWNSIQIARSRGEKTRTLEMLGLVLMHGTLSDDERRDILGNTFPQTNLQRLVNTPEFLQKLGLKWENDDYVFLDNKNESIELCTRAVREILEGKSVTEIKSQAQRLAYGDELRKKAGLSMATTNGSSESPNAISAKTTQSGGTSYPSTGGANLPPSKKRTLKKSNLRSKLIPSRFSIHIHDPRINEIFIELKNLRLAEFRNAASVLFRVFLEFSIDEYIHKNKLVVTRNSPTTKPFTCPSCKSSTPLPPPKAKTPTFAEKMQTVIAFMEKTSVMSKNELKPARKAVSDRDNILHPENFNAFVHNPTVIPAEKELNDMWDTLEPFISKLW